jgi:N-acetylmuramoyl-L-alanine amidase
VISSLPSAARRLLQRGSLGAALLLVSVALVGGRGEAQSELSGSAGGRCDPPELHIALDVGHGPGGGATSARGVPEWVFNHRLALELEQALHAAGFGGSFVLDREGVGLGLRERPARAAALGADLLLSVHHDSVQESLLSLWEHDGRALPHCDAHRGFSLFVSERNGDPRGSVEAAVALGDQLVAQGLRPSLYHALPIPGEGRTLLDPHAAVFRRDGLAVLAHASMPAVLFEAGMIIHRDDEADLQEPAYRSMIADAVVCAAMQLCEAWAGLPGAQ